MSQTENDLLLGWVMSIQSRLTVPYFNSVGTVTKLEFDGTVAQLDSAITVKRWIDRAWSSTKI